MSDSFLRSVSVVDIGKAAVQRGQLSGQLVQVFIRVSAEAVFTCTAALSSASTFGEVSLRRRIHSREVLCSEASNLVAIGALRILRAVQDSSLRVTFQHKKRDAGNPGRFLHDQNLKIELSRSARRERIGQF